MRAKMSVFAQALQMRSGDAIDDLGVRRCVFEDASFELKQLGDVARNGRVIPRLKENRRGRIAHSAQLAILGYQVVDQGDPG